MEGVGESRRWGGSIYTWHILGLFGLILLPTIHVEATCIHNGYAKFLLGPFAARSSPPIGFAQLPPIMSYPAFARNSFQLSPTPAPLPDNLTFQDLSSLLPSHIFPNHLINFRPLSPRSYLSSFYKNHTRYQRDYKERSEY